MKQQFRLHAFGEIRSGSFEYGVKSCGIKYSILSSRPVNDDELGWQILSGNDNGITQRSSGNENFAVWNCPFECSFVSSTPLGWPRMCLTVFGHDWIGREIVLGYGSTLIPLSKDRRTIREVQLVKPKPTSWLRGLMGTITSSPPVLVDPEKFFTATFDPYRAKSLCMQPAGGTIEIVFYTSIEPGEDSNLHFQ
jgi:hypothetical protein